MAVKQQTEVLDFEKEYESLPPGQTQLILHGQLRGLGFGRWQNPTVRSPAAVDDGEQTPRAKQVDKTDDDDKEEISMEYVRKMDYMQAKRKLTQFKGAGEKTEACVLLFGLRRAVFPVDTQVCRVVGCIGWTRGFSVSAEDTAREMDARIPHKRDIRLGLHMLLIRLGKSVCRASKVEKANCGECLLPGVCATGGRRGTVEKRDGWERGRTKCRGGSEGRITGGWSMEGCVSLFM